jgi:glycosyltransferase involved in cell wall biosynthesis
MKIALITPWYGEFAGGAEVLARSISENLSKGGLIVEVLTTCSRSPFDSWWDDYHAPGQYLFNNVVVRRFPVNKGTQDWYHAINHQIINGIRVSPAGEREYLKGSINSDELVMFVQTHQSEYIFLLIPYLYGLIYWSYLAAPGRCILIPCIHDEPQAYFSTTGEMLRSCFLAFNTPEEMALAHKIHSINADNAAVCGCGVDLPCEFFPEKFREKFNIHFPYLLYAGRKDIGKNVIDLINSFDMYKQTVRDDLRMIFIGGGDASLIPDKDYFIDLGYVSEEDKFNAYAGAFTTCQLSKNESFSFVIMESWGASTPVIVSEDCPVTRNHSLRSNGGLPVRNADEFIEAICYLRKHPNIRAGLGSNGREYVLKNYIWLKVVQRYETLIKKMELH